MLVSDTWLRVQEPFSGGQNGSRSATTLFSNIGYTGQRADSATGLAYYHARYYDPAPGQFTSADTVDDRHPSP